MRTFLFAIIVLAGPALGLLLAGEEDWPTRMVIAAIGAMISTPLAALVAGVGRNSWVRLSPVRRTSGATEASSQALAENFWRDQGHPPFAKPPDALPDKHQFDPDKLS